MCSVKKYQYYIATMLAIFFSLHYYRIDTPCFIYYLPVAIVILFIPRIWNHFIYSSLTEGIKKPISYKAFQCIMTIALLFLLFVTMKNFITGYIPNNYVQGIC